MAEATSPERAALAELGARLARQRLERNLTQAALAREAGVSKSTVERLENGESTQLSSFLRILRALGLAENLASLVPEPALSPIELLKLRGKQRRRASSKSRGSGAAKTWKWDDEA